MKLSSSPPLADAEASPPSASARGEQAVCDAVRASAPAPPFAESSAEAKRVAAAVLEVLAGTRGPAEAAAALGISLPRYYQLEGRALAGLLAACEPRRGGRTRGGNEVTALRQECERLHRECARQQALVRAAQRSVGLAPPPPPPPRTTEGGRKRRRRRPKARALKVVAMLRQPAGTADAAADVPVAAPAGGAPAGVATESSSASAAGG
jgi:hypothetical protein